MSADDTGGRHTVGPRPDTYRCESCGWSGPLHAAISHEHNRHDGAQTCWPALTAIEYRP